MTGQFSGSCLRTRTNACSPAESRKPTPARSITSRCGLLAATSSHIRSAGCVDDWLRATGSARGYVMDLATLWRLAAHWYDGRLERGYVRRDPVEAKEYLRGVGLSGPFWGL